MASPRPVASLDNDAGSTDSGIGVCRQLIANMATTKAGMADFPDFTMFFLQCMMNASAPFALLSSCCVQAICDCYSDGVSASHIGMPIVADAPHGIERHEQVRETALIEDATAKRSLMRVLHTE